VKTVPVHSRSGVIAHALVDDEDFELVNQHRWSDSGKGYVRTARRENGKTINRTMHRMLLGCVPHDGQVVDHLNGNPYDNRRRNLQLVTALENAQRRGARKVATTSSRGVHRLKTNGKFQASVRYRDRLMHLGTWDTEEEAADIAARVRGALMAHSQEAYPCAA
jgi:hypothetical protein